jgi:hypothetical protein
MKTFDKPEKKLRDAFNSEGPPPTGPDLDELFGDLRTPFAVPPARPTRRWEERFTPFSWNKLDAWGARPLKQFMEDTADGWNVGNILFKDVIVIWVVNESGDVLYALEELVVRGAPANLPKFQNLPMMKRMPKLGHPSLIEGRDGRIGGEIKPIILNGMRFSHWEINNKSGRYGLYTTRRKEHLENVAGKFFDLGIQLKTRFIKPVRR